MSSITPGISLLGMTTAQTTRLIDMRRTLDDLQRQIGTQKKYDNLAGFGLNSQLLLQLRSNNNQLQSYNDNIDTAIGNITAMSDSLTKMVDVLNKIISLVQSQPQDQQFDTTIINQQAQQALEFIGDVSNLTLTGRYLFAGTDAQNPPVANLTTIKTNMTNEIAQWMNGTISTTQIISQTDAFSGVSLGFSSTLSSAINVNTRISDALEISYGAVADRSGIQDALRALGLMANLRPPNLTTDVPDNTQFGTVIDHVLSVARNAVSQMQVAQGKLNGALTLASNIQENHKQDINLFTKQIEGMENSDTTVVLVQLQSIQTQLTASYEATRIVSQLSLVNFLS